MESTELVRKLVVGSETIDRMRKEINSVVKTVLGLIQRECDSTSWIDVTGQTFHPEVLITLSYPYIKGVCGWSVTGWTMSGGHRTPGWMAQCSLSDPFNLGSQIYCSNESYSVSLQNVKTVHDNLGVFVEKMIKKFPFLTERLQPLLDAADYDEKVSEARSIDRKSSGKLPNDRKSRALMQIVERIIARHHRGVVSLDEPTFELYELAKQIHWAENEKQFQSVLTEITNFNK